MPTIKDEIVKDLLSIEDDLGNPTFTWNGNAYVCTASAAEIERDVDTGGFQLVKILTLTVRLIDEHGNYTFPNNTIPKSQQKIVYDIDQLVYRIISVKTHTTGAFVRLTCQAETRGA